MDINLDLLKTFYVVAKNKNITKASEELITTQPAISKAIKNLEEQLEVKLFIRSKKGVELTKEGQILFNTTQKILEELEKTINNIKDTNQINILVGKVLAEKILYPYISIFKEKYKDIKLNISTTSINGIQKSLKEKQTDLAIGYYINDLPDTFIQEKIQSKLLPIFVCNNKYIELTKKRIDIKELEKYPFIISAKGATTHELALEIFKKYELNIKPSMEILGTSLITQSVKQGMGISILTKEFISEELERNELYEIKLNQKLESRQLAIQYLKDTKLKKETQYLIDLLKEK